MIEARVGIPCLRKKDKLESLCFIPQLLFLAVESLSNLEL